MKTNKSKWNFKKLSSTFAVGTLIALFFLIIGFATDLPILEDDVEVEPNTELIYYLNVQYDGVDRKGLDSEGLKSIVDIESNTIHVEDKIPEGLTFENFITTSDGSIGAVSRSDGKMCTGYVVDDTPNDPTNEGTWNSDRTQYTYHGLHYNENTRTVSFDVRNLQAGCVLQVGITTRTPKSIDDPATPDIKETRRDFYNFATFRENALTGKSNTVHAWMGKEDIATFNIEYKYEGTLPHNAPNPPEITTYAVGASVGVASDVNIEGYTFSGWKTEDVTVENGKFIMPDKNVVFVGSFTKNIEKYKVTYKIDGIIPDGYVIPTEKEYYPSSSVKVDSLQKGDIFNGYRFIGWNIDGITITDDGYFEMPEENVVITGKFEEVKYKVEYRFYDTVRPSNYKELLPETKEYKPGETIKLEQPKEAEGYEFLGWYKDDEFIMPEEDVIIYGEWKELKGKFSPTITKEVISTKNYYQPGDIVKYKITVENNENFTIKDIVIKENNEKAYFIEENGYEVISSQYVSVDTINAGRKAIIYAEYKVTKEDKGTITNEVEIIGAFADKHTLNPEENHKAQASFDVKSKIKIVKKIEKNKGNVDDVFQFHIKGSAYDSWIILNEDNECAYVYVEPGKYQITEIVSQDYSLKDVEGSLASNGSTLNVKLGKEYIITFTNKYKKYGFFHSVGRVVNKITDAFKGEE